MESSDIQTRLQKIDDQLSLLPDAFLVYKTIHGKKQPYLQWHENGKTKSIYVKLEERDRILMEINKRTDLLQEKKHLLSYADKLQNAWMKYPGLQKQSRMTLPIGIGIQSFERLMEKHLFYVDKSMFIKDWWEDPADVTLITRPRRFGKSLNLDMLDCFFSDRYEKRPDLFSPLQIWESKKFRQEQGTWPVLHLDFSNMKLRDYSMLKFQVTQCILNQYYQHHLLSLEEWDIQAAWSEVRIEAELNRLCRVLSERSSGKKVIILIDEYDTPIQEVWGTPSYDQTVTLMRNIFHCLLKGNTLLEKGLLTGITRVSRESLFSDMNNLYVSSVTDSKYDSYFGFTEEEVFAALDSQDLIEHEEVKRWYDGFTIGSRNDIYNPWSITYYLKVRKFDTYWANTSANTLISQLLQGASPHMKDQFVRLMDGQSVDVILRENITWEDLQKNESLIWGLLLSTGYVTGICKDSGNQCYQIRLTNWEVMCMFQDLFQRWFSGGSAEDKDYFLQAMFEGDSLTMTDTLNAIMMETFSYFDVGSTTENRKTENFYHGFVLGILSSLRNKYLITSNRESGYGRYDVMIEPRTYNGREKAVILEFKVENSSEAELALSQQAEKALAQIKERNYAAQLLSRGIAPEAIYLYGIAFRNRQALCLVEEIN